MRDYGKVYSSFWTSEDARALSEDGRMLAIYLMTSPHGNMLGCFRLPNAYASDDMQWGIERVSKGFEELYQNGFAYRCERSFWVVIHKHLKWNRLDNENVGKAAAKLYDSAVPPDAVKPMLAAALREFGKNFPEQKLLEIEAAAKRYRDGIETLSKPVAVAVAVAVTGTVALTVPGAVANPYVEQDEKKDDIETIFRYWQKIMNSPKSVLDENRRGLIKRALEKYSAADICKAIRGCSKSPHNMGDNDQKTKYNGLDLILRNAEKIDRFIGLDAGNARPANETLEQRNARIEAEFLGAPADENTIDMES